MISENTYYSRISVEDRMPTKKGLYYTDNGFNKFMGKSFYKDCNWWEEPVTGYLLSEEQLRELFEKGVKCGLKNANGEFLQVGQIFEEWL